MSTAKRACPTLERALRRLIFCPKGLTKSTPLGKAHGCFTRRPRLYRRKRRKLSTPKWLYNPWSCLTERCDAYLQGGGRMTIGKRKEEISTQKIRVFCVRFTAARGRAATKTASAGAQHRVALMRTAGIRIYLKGWEKEREKRETEGRGGGEARRRRCSQSFLEPLQLSVPIHSKAPLK